MHIVLSQQPGHAHNHTHLEGLSHCNVSHCMLGVKVGYTYWDTTSLAYGVVTSPPSLFPTSFLPLPLFPLPHLFSSFTQIQRSLVSSVVRASLPLRSMLTR